jgi:DNA-binding MarR family transcriptional regulator
MTPAVSEPHLTAWRAVLNAQTSVVADAEAALTAAGLPPLAWYDVLWAIRRAPDRRVRMAELAASLTISRGGLTKIADRLEHAGLIRREPVADDGRGLYVVLTPAGTTLLRRMWPVYARVLHEAFGSMTTEEAAVVADVLGRITDRGNQPQRKSGGQGRRRS